MIYGYARVSSFGQARDGNSLEAQEKATYDYILADLIGKSVSRLYSSSNTMPDIAEVYPSLFDSKESHQYNFVRFVIVLTAFVVACLLPH